MEKPESPVTWDKCLLSALLDLMKESESISIEAGSLSTAFLKLAANLRLDDNEGDEEANARIRELRCELLPLLEQVSALENFAISMSKKKQEIDTKIKRLENRKGFRDRQRTALAGTQQALKDLGDLYLEDFSEGKAALIAELTKFKGMEEEEEEHLIPCWWESMEESMTNQTNELPSAQRGSVFSSPTLQVSCLCLCVLFAGGLLKAWMRQVCQCCHLTSSFLNIFFPRPTKPIFEFSR